MSIGLTTPLFNPVEPSQDGAVSEKSFAHLDQLKQYHPHVMTDLEEYFPKKSTFGGLKERVIQDRKDKFNRFVLAEGRST